MCAQLPLLQQFTFHVTAAGDGFPDDDSYAQEFIRSLDLKIESGCWATVDFDDPRFERFLDAAEDRIRRGEAQLFGGVLGQRYDTSSPRDPYWYQLRPTAEFPGDVDDVKAYRVARGATVAAGLNTFVNEHVRRHIEEANLLGVDFVWARDVGKYEAAQWFLPVPQRPMGRGLYHPWVDPERISDEFDVPGRQTGTVLSFLQEDMRSDIDFGDKRHARIFALAGAKDDVMVTVRAPSCFLQQPVHEELDFAYGIHPEIESRNDLYLSARAAQSLLEARLIQPAELVAADVVATAPAGTAEPECEHPIPEAYLGDLGSRAQIAGREAAYHKLCAQQRPPRPAPKLAEALKLLRKRKKDNSADLAQGASKKQLATATLPDDWKKVLAVTNGGTLHDECQVLPLDELATTATQKRELVESLYEDVPWIGQHQPIAQAPDGDWYSLEIVDARENPRVLRITHEGAIETESWSTISTFLVDLLTGEYR
ncbi:MAG: SMI1/KNR4 family protein [Verrucomicrobiota bacterium]